MEQFVGMLYDRLEDKKDLQLQLFVIMQNAINEMHNNGIIASLTGDTARAVHDPDPNVRVREKTKVAKSVGKQFIPATMPVPSQGGLSYQATLNYDPRFVNSITLCLQGGIEGLYTAFAVNTNIKLDTYIIQVISNGSDLTVLENNIALLDRMYEEISLVLMCDGKVLYNGQEKKSSPTPVVQEDLGFFARLFGKSGKASSNTAPATPVNSETVIPQPEGMKPAAAPIRKPEAPVSPAVRTAPAAPRVSVQPAPEKTGVWLSDLCRGPAPVKKISEEQAAKLRELGAAFFDGCDQIMVTKPGNTPSLQYEAMSLIRQLLQALPVATREFALVTRCPEAGRLKYNAYWCSGGTCYDGGCYSDEPSTDYYYNLRRISFEEYEEKKKDRETLDQNRATGWRFSATLPYADQTEVFLFGPDYAYLYLKDPMGILGYYEIEFECQA